MPPQINRTAFLLTGLLLGVIVVIIYWPALTGSFVNYDDPLYLTENPLVQGGFSWQALQWSFTSLSVGHWHPITWISHLVGVHLFGLNPFGHHLISLLLHYVNALLLATVLYGMTKQFWQSWLVTVLFAVHPLNVESAAWVAERKGVLAAFFWLLAIQAYIMYVRKPTWPRYLPVILFFSLGIGSKAMVVTLPCVLLLLDFWPLHRIQSVSAPDRCRRVYRLIVEKVPFLMLSALAGAGAIYAMVHGGAANSYPLALRLLNVIRGYAGYVSKLCYPVNLSISYPFDSSPSLWKIVLILTMLVAATVFVISKRNKSPYLFTGWLWYLIALLPVIGFLNLNLGQQTMPDRYIYIPIIGLLIIVVWGGNYLLDRLNFTRKLKTSVVILIISWNAFLTWNQSKFWHDSKALFIHEVAFNPTSSLAHNNLGCALIERGEFEASYQEFEEAVRLDPRNDDAWCNLGLSLGKTGRHDETVSAYLQALAIDPLHVKARFNLGMEYVWLNRVQEACKEYQILQNLSPEYAEKMAPYMKSSCN